MTDEPIDPPAEDSEHGSVDPTPRQPTIRGGAAELEADSAADAEVPGEVERPLDPESLVEDGSEEALDDHEVDSGPDVEPASQVPTDTEVAEPASAKSDLDEPGADTHVDVEANPDTADAASHAAADTAEAARTDADDLEWPPEPRPPRSGGGGRLAMIGLGAIVGLLLLGWGCSALLSGDDDPVDENGSGESISAPTTGPTTVEEAESPGEVVVVARPTWRSGWFQAEVNAALIRELGYTVNDPSTLERDPGSVYPSMARGEIDVWAHAWLPGHNRFIDTAAISLVGPQVIDGGPTGLIVPTEWAQQNGVSTMDDVLASQQLIDDLDLDGDGVLDILGCEPDWICWSHIENLIEANGWPARQQSNTHEFHIEAMEQRLDIGLATMVFAWGPDSMLHRLALGDQVQWLSITSDIPEFELTAMPVTATVPDGHCTADPCISPFLHDEIHVAANADFLSTHPDIAALMEVVEIPAEDIWKQNERMRTGEASVADVERHAAEWIAEHRDLVDSWLGS